MEFIEYLDKAEIEILKIVENAGYKTEENTALCLLSDNYVGFLNKKKKKNYNLHKQRKEKRGLHAFTK